MNFLSNLSTTKNSVNSSSLATIKPPKDINETINKYQQKCKIRFSHQEQVELPKKLQRNSSYKEKMKFEQFFDESIVGCMNHENKEATHVILSDSDSPMYYCERCAILIASKGFNVQPIGSEINKENRNKMNCKRGSFSQYDTNNNRKQAMNSQNNKTLQPGLNSTLKPQPPIKFHLSNEIISQLQHCWKGLKSGRESNLNQIDMYINTLNENVDFLQDYYYVLHQYIEKQKNIQLKDILAKKQLLEQLRSQVSGFFVKSFTSLKQLKDTLVKIGECSLEMYQQVIRQATYQKFSLNFEAAIEEVSMLNSKKTSIVHKIGEQITHLIKNFHLICQKNDAQTYEKRNSTYGQDHKPISYLKKVDSTTRLNDNSYKNQINPPKQQPIGNPYGQHQLPNIPGVNNVQSSVRSLQLSFDNSQNDSESSPRKMTQREETNNFTLNQYINQRGEESYTNLLMTSTDIN